LASIGRVTRSPIFALFFQFNSEAEMYFFQIIIILCGFGGAYQWRNVNISMLFRVKQKKKNPKIDFTAFAIRRVLILSNARPGYMQGYFNAAQYNFCAISLELIFIDCKERARAPRKIYAAATQGHQ
jgi:hypothetical protein